LAVAALNARRMIGGVGLFVILNDMNKAARKMLRDIQQYGWHVLKVMEDDKGPAFAFTIGLFHCFKHPEVLMIGLDLDFMHRIIPHIY
jgi:hypothetical protein